MVLDIIDHFGIREGYIVVLVWQVYRNMGKGMKSERLQELEEINHSIQLENAKFMRLLEASKEDKWWLWQMLLEIKEE